MDIALWVTRNRLLSWYRECECADALETLAGLRMLGSVPSMLSEEVPRDQTEAMITHDITRDFEGNLRLAAAHMKTKLLVVVGDDDRVVTPGPAREFARQSVTPIVELDADCGHGDPWCAQDEFAYALRTFIAP